MRKPMLYKSGHVFQGYSKKLIKNAMNTFFYLSVLPEALIASM
jgi:hypothetical protein